MRWCSVLFARLLWGVFFLTMVSGAHAVDAVIVSGDRSPGYVEAAQTIAAEFGKAQPERGEPPVFYVTEGQAQDGMNFQGVKVIVTLGSEALRRVLSKEVRVPIVAALIPKAGLERIVRESAHKPFVPLSALYLDQPFPRQIELIRLALPNARKIGVLWGAESGLQTSALQSAMQAKGFELVNGYVGGGSTLFAGLKAVLDDTDALLAVPDPLVYNGSSISNVLLATYRARVPVIAFSPAYVRAGALLSLHSTPRQIGLQAFAMARALSQGASGPMLQYPSDFSVVLNDQVARSLELLLDEKSLTERLKRVERKP